MFHSKMVTFVRLFEKGKERKAHQQADFISLHSESFKLLFLKEYIHTVLDNSVYTKWFSN